MISWGTKYVNIGSYLHKHEEECKVCGKSSEHTYIGERAIFTMFGMSLAPTGRTYYKICPHCKTRLKVKHGDKVLPYAEEAIPGKPKLSYFWGWFIVLPVIAFVVYLYYWVTSN